MNTQDEGASLPFPSVPTESMAQRLLRWADETRTDNIADEIEPGKLTAIGMEAERGYRIDLQSRSQWAKEAQSALDLALQRAQPKSFPWPDASNVILPIMTEAADQFAARAYPAIIQDRNVVKGTVVGSDSGVPAVDEKGAPILYQDPATGQMVQTWVMEPGEKQRRADRIGEHMSWQLLEEQPEWEEDTDRMLHVLPIVGCAFRKTCFDPSLGRNSSVYVSALKVVINYWAKSMQTAPRISEELLLYPHEIEEYKRSGHFRQSFDAKRIPASGDDKQAPHAFIEQHCRIDLDEDGYDEPYIVTFHLDSMQVARVAPRFDKEGVAFKNNVVQRITAIELFTKYDFLPNKEGGIYGQGFGQLLSPLNHAANSLLNQIIDGGTLANMQGGFIGKGLSIHTGALRRTMGEWTVVSAAGNDIRNAVVPITHQGPPAVLFSVLGMIMDIAKGVSAVKDVLSGEVRAQSMSPTVFMALVEQGLKVFTSIWKRIHNDLKSELDKLYRLNRIYLPQQTSFKIGNEWKNISQQDYALGAGVEPVSDKNMVADVQKLARAEFLERLKDDPLMDGMKIRQYMLEAAGFTNADKLIKVQQDENPELLMRIGEMEMRTMAAKAAAIRDISAAVKNLADADATILEPFNAWVTSQIQSMQDGINALSTKGNNGVDAGGAGPVEGQPGQQGIPGLPR